MSTAGASDKRMLFFKDKIRKDLDTLEINGFLTKLDKYSLLVELDQCNDYEQIK